MLGTLVKLFIATFLVTPVGVWAFLGHCYWRHVGWCNDFEPFVAFVLGPPTVFVLMIVFYFLFRVLRPTWPTTSCAAASTLVVLLAFGGYFHIAENYRKRLVQAVANNDLESAQRWLRYGASPDSRKNSRGETVLLLAVTQKSVPMMELLLDAGANPNIDGGCSIYNILFGAYLTQDPAIIAAAKRHGAGMFCPRNEKLLIEKYDISPAEFRAR
jgi:hypothetical protein